MCALRGSSMVEQLPVKRQPLRGIAVANFGISVNPNVFQTKATPREPSKAYVKEGRRRD